MAKKIYVGTDSVEKWLYNNASTLVKTDFVYKTTMGFELDFTYLGGSSATYHHILNAGGTGNATNFSVNVAKRNRLLTFEGCTTGRKASIMTYTITPNVRYVLSYIIDTVNNTGTYTLKEHDTGTILVTGTKNISLFTPGGFLSIFNSQTWTQTSSTDRGAYIKFYGLKIYDGSALTKNLIPTGTAIDQPGLIYDTVNEENLPEEFSNTLLLYDYTGGPNTPKEAKKIYVGVNGQARKVSKAYIGVNGQAKLCYEDNS